MRSLLFLMTVMLGLSVHAQEDTLKSPEYGWKNSLVAGLTLTQVSYTNWVQGGENSLAWALSLDGKSVQDLKKTTWSNSYKFAFGQARLGSADLRKTDDKIELETVVTLKLGTYVNPYGAATLKTQFARGYKYDSTGKREPVSRFFDPGYLTQSVGAEYQPIPEFKTRLGAALREILTSEFPGYADDPKTAEIERTRVDGAFESVTDVEWKLEENILFTSKLELFAPFKTLDQIVFRSDNSIAVKVNKYVTVNLNVQFINERRVSPRTQIKETLAIGLSYTLL